jgi:hypothetical protein
MRDVGFARQALLAQVLFRAELVRFADPFYLGGRKICLELI